MFFPVSRMSSAENEVKAIKEVTMLDLRKIIEHNNGKIILVSFWETGCCDCLNEVLALISIRNKYSIDEVRIIGVSFNGDGIKILPEFIKQHEINYSIYVMANDRSVIDKYRLKGLPTTALYNKDGYLIKIYAGFRREAILDQEISELLKIKINRRD